MDNPITAFMDKAKALTRNPLGIIALFISLIYGFACLVLGISINNLKGPCERLPLIWFIILFPLLILAIFTFLVIKHHSKLYAPGDFQDERNFNNTYLVTKDVNSNLDKVLEKHTQVANDENNEALKTALQEIEELKKTPENIAIDESWTLNHWGGHCAKIINGKMVFEGATAPSGDDGSNINLKNYLEIGKQYRISCFVKSITGTKAKFALWCHDNIDDGSPNGISVITPFATPPNEGNVIDVYFQPQFNTNVRIHFQYRPGQGRIEVSDLNIKEINGNPPLSPSRASISAAVLVPGSLV